MSVAVLKESLTKGKRIKGKVRKDSPIVPYPLNRS
jgi:hypothetical protein